MTGPSSERESGRIAELEAEVAHWKAHAEEAGRGFTQVCQDYARSAAERVALRRRVEAVLPETETHDADCDCTACAVRAALATPTDGGSDE